jgi:hypothetical protein
MKRFLQWFREITERQQRGLRNIAQRVIGQVRHVRRHDDVGKRHQATERVVLQHVGGTVTVEDRRLVLVDVERSAADLSALDALDKCLRVDQPAATGIDDQRAAFHPGDRFRVHHVLGFLGQRHVKHDDVTVAGQVGDRG